MEGKNKRKKEKEKEMKWMKTVDIIIPLEKTNGI